MLADPNYRKTDKVRDFLAAGMLREALSVAKDFKILTKEDKRDIMRAHESIHYPDTYRQLRMDPAMLQRRGAEVLLRLYGPQTAVAA